MTDIERIGLEHTRMMDYVRHELGNEHHERGPLERSNPRKFDPRDYYDMAYRPDLYAIEPAVLDDLEKAKAEGDEERVEKIRHHLRAMSWGAHGRTDTEVAKRHAEQLLRAAQSEIRSRTQKGFEFANPEVAEWTRVLNTLSEIECRGSMVAKPVNFLETQMIESWKELIGIFKDKANKGKSDWPTTWPVKRDPPVLSPDVQRVSHKLTAERHIHDMLLYQLLYPKHCMYAQKSRSL